MYHWNALIATLILSLMVHALTLLAVSLRRAPESPRMRVVAKVDVIDKLQAPPPPKEIERPKFVPPPPPDKVVKNTGHQGTRPGVGGDPAPAPKSLKMELPKNQVPQAANRNSAVLTDRSVDGDPDRGNAFGDPNGVHGGTGTGGTGPGGTGGDGDGGTAPPPPPQGPEALLRSGHIQCTGCHFEPVDAAMSSQPANIEALEHDTTWSIRGGGTPPPGRKVDVTFEFQVAPDGKIEKVTVLENTGSNEEKEALVYFARMHQFTPPNRPIRIHAHYSFYPLR